MVKQTAGIFAAVLIVVSAAHAETIKKSCMFTTSEGVIRQVESEAEVPPEYAQTAKCFVAREKIAKPKTQPANRPKELQDFLKQVTTQIPNNRQVRTAAGDKNDNLAAPDDIKLEGSQRSELINSPLGQVSLRWPRKVETLFGRTPLRAMTDAANTVSRALKNGGFPNQMQNLSVDLKVIFMDENLPTSQIPQSLVSNCHPGWMTPPGNVYVVAQRVAGGCGTTRSTTSVADSTLTEVLIHELGHVVEFHMLGGRARFDRMRAEGFATWFEEYASQYSSIVNSSDIKRRHSASAAAAIQNNPNTFQFSGSGEDYARAAMYFRALVAPRGLRGLADVYEQMNSRGMDFRQAINEEFRWDERRLNKEVQDAVRSR